MIISNINEKAWKLLLADCEGFKPFKKWDLTPTKLQYRYRKLVETEFYNRKDIIILELSQPQHTDFSFPLNCCYQYDKLVEARGGCQSDGMYDNLYLRDTKENLLEWLEFVKESILEKYDNKGTTKDNSNESRDNFVRFINLSISELSNSNEKRVKISNVYDIERQAI